MHDKSLSKLNPVMVLGQFHRHPGLEKSLDLHGQPASYDRYTIVDRHALDKVKELLPKEFWHPILRIEHSHDGVKHNHVLLATAAYIQLTEKINTMIKEDE